MIAKDFNFWTALGVSFLFAFLFKSTHSSNKK
jgi:hypothetical protein